MFLAAIFLLLTVAAVNSQVPGPIPDYRGRPYYDEAPKPYSFNFNTVHDDGIGQISRTETADGSGRVQGSYTLVNDEGHTRVVDYVADQDGFRAHIRTNEPGTDNQNPADVIMESSSVFANRNFQYNQGLPIRRPVTTGLEPVAPEYARVDPEPRDYIVPDRRPAYVRPPAPVYTR